MSEAGIFWFDVTNVQLVHVFTDTQLQLLQKANIRFESFS